MSIEIHGLGMMGFSLLLRNEVGPRHVEEKEIGHQVEAPLGIHATMSWQGTYLCVCVQGGIEGGIHRAPPFGTKLLEIGNNQSLQYPGKVTGSTDIRSGTTQIPGIWTHNTESGSQQKLRGGVLAFIFPFPGL